MIPFSLVLCSVLAKEPAPPLRGEITVTEDVTVRVKPGLNDLQEQPLNLILEGTVDFLVNIATW